MRYSVPSLATVEHHLIKKLFGSSKTQISKTPQQTPNPWSCGGTYVRRPRRRTTAAGVREAPGPARQSRATTNDDDDDRDGPDAGPDGIGPD